MNDTNSSVAILKALLVQAPLIFVCSVGLVVAVRSRRKTPSASLWTAAAFALALFICGQMVLMSVAWTGGWPARSDFTRNFLIPILRAVSYGLLLVGVYAGRASHSTTPTDSFQSVWQPMIASMRARPGLKKVFFGVFAMVFLLVLLVNTLVTLMSPESFLSTARIRLRPEATNVAGENPPPDVFATLDARLIQTECEVIQSEVILGPVVDQLDLNHEWGKKYAGGEKLKTFESIQLLKARIEVRPMLGTSIIEIRSYGEHPSEAAKIAEALAESYSSYRAEQRQLFALRTIQPLKERWDEQELQVREAEIALERVRQQLNVPREEVLWTNSNGEPESLRPYFEAKRKLRDLESQRQNLH